MAIVYAQEFVGRNDGTALPPKRLDGSVIGAKKRRIRASKVPAANAVGDQIYIGKLPAGANPCEFRVCSDTALGAVTLSIGTLANPTKYVNAKTCTVADVPQLIGPKAAALQQLALVADEDMYVTIGGAAMPAAAIVTFGTEYTISA